MLCRHFTPTIASTARHTRNPDSYQFLSRGGRHAHASSRSGRTATADGTADAESGRTEPPRPAAPRARALACNQLAYGLCRTCRLARDSHMSLTHTRELPSPHTTHARRA